MPTGHDRQVVRMGLDALVTVGCECGQTWVLKPGSDMGQGQTVAMRHALNPNVGDPRKEVRKEPVKPSGPTPSVLADYLKKARQRAPRGPP
jgi:hypothetical protein